MSEQLIKEAVIKILEVLSTVAPAESVVSIEGDETETQHVIDESEVKECQKLLEAIDPANQQLRLKKLMEK